MKEVVWIFGTSASGKETFIRKVVKNKRLQEQLCWSNKKVVACPESLKLVYQHRGPAFSKLREAIVKSVPKLLKSSDVVLIKWQSADSKALRILKLKKLLPGARHSIILLKSPTVELLQRLDERTWWDQHVKETSFFRKEFYSVAKKIKEVPALKVTILDSSKGGSYKQRR